MWWGPMLSVFFGDRVDHSLKNTTIIDCDCIIWTHDILINGYRLSSWVECVFCFFAACTANDSEKQNQNNRLIKWDTDTEHAFCIQC